jgi:hypothetical protein
LFNGLTVALVHALSVLLSLNQMKPAMPRIAGPLLACALVFASAPTNAQASSDPAIQDDREDTQPFTGSGQNGATGQPPTADDVFRALEQAAAENALPVEFFARVIWQESRFNAKAVSPKGAEGIAQFMPRTGSWHGLFDPFDPIDALRHSAAYLRELLDRFGNLGLAAAAYNAGPGRVSAWLTSHRALPAETRNYVSLVTGWTADEWASSSPPEKADTTIPQGVPCTRLANLILGPKQERQRIAAYVPRWGIQLAAHLSESTAWAIYRDRLKRFGSFARRHGLTLPCAFRTSSLAWDSYGAPVKECQQAEPDAYRSRA